MKGLPKVMAGESGLERSAPEAAWEHLLAAMTSYYRQAAVGRRITGIIHTFNTPLQVIQMQAELMARKLQEEEAALAPELPPHLLPVWQEFFTYRQRKNSQLVDIAQKLQQLINWLRYRGLHEDQHGPQTINLNELVQTELQGYEMEQFFKNQLTRQWQQQDFLPPIVGYYVDFSQSFCNLVDNALEALQEVAAPVLTIATVMAEGHRIIAVGDNGPGIPPEQQSRLFTPFFTTKHTSERPRAGLGLYFAQELLRPYGGRISFTSQPGQTWFRIILP